MVCCDKNLKTLITLIPIFDLVSDYWLILTEKSWDSENDLELYAFYMFCVSQFLMIWGSNAWWTFVHFKDPVVKVDCELPIKCVLLIIPWAWIYYYIYPWVRYPVMMPLFLFMAVGWWQETNECVKFMFYYLYPNNYYSTFVLDCTDGKWSSKNTSCFTATARYFTTFAAGMRGLIDMASHEKVADLLVANEAPAICTKLLSLGALLEELTENGGGIIISVLAIMRDKPSAAAYTSLIITVISFLIETGRMLGKIHIVYNKKPCMKFGQLLVRLYRKFQCLFCTCLWGYSFCKCCNKSGGVEQCCLCPERTSVSPVRQDDNKESGAEMAPV